ncbi:Bro-N domain-containing protein [Acinetobacter sp. CFCC 11171]|uniref:BRO-N domain-containing protein n=1 Tax=Acinetobacter sp. CFCC 11171 TaxID=1775558 RepID=UPI000DD0E8B9|nr:BRO family protein [Acinetobacter sp. CFCC 11171]
MNPSIFNFNEYGVRVAFDENGEPMFCLPDICKVMNISRSSDLVQVSKGYVKNETPRRQGALNPTGVHKIRISTNGGMQELVFINEENLYRVIFRSNKPEALNFQNWVFAEVLPSIRKTGSYSARQTAYEELNRLCMQEKTQKAKGSFHGTGLVNHRYSMRDLNLRITTCKANLQLTFEGVDNE